MRLLGEAKMVYPVRGCDRVCHRTSVSYEAMKGAVGPSGQLSRDCLQPWIFPAKRLSTLSWAGQRVQKIVLPRDPEHKMFQ
jgi:hypothetical protein